MFMTFSVKKNPKTTEATYERLRNIGFNETEDGFYKKIPFGKEKKATAREVNVYSV